MEGKKRDEKQILSHMIGAGISGCITECIVLPVDTLKTRLMVDSTAPVSVKSLTNAIHTLRGEGTRSFFRGLTPGLHRQLVFASSRIGLYDPVMILRLKSLL